MASLEVWGGTTEHGRACYYVSYQQISLLFDCGIHKKDGRLPEINYTKIPDLNYIFLTHAHEDHAQGMIELIRRGYNKKVWMLKETGRQLYKIYNNVLKQYEHSFCYIDEYTQPCQWYPLSENLSVFYGASGHMNGSIWYLIKVYDKIIFYSGDYNSEAKILPFNDPCNAFNENAIDIAIIDCANGVDIWSYDHCLSKIYHEVDKVIQQKGLILFPTTGLSKIVELIILLRQKYREIIFYYFEDIYHELMHFIHQMHLESLPFDNIRTNKVIQHDEDLPDQCGIIFWEELKEPLYQDSLWMKQLNSCSHNAVICTLRLQNNTNRLFEEEGIGAKKYSFNIMSHQGIQGVKAILDGVCVKKALLCHCEEERNKKATSQLQEEGYTNVEVCRINSKISF